MSVLYPRCTFVVGSRHVSTPDYALLTPGNAVIGGGIPDGTTIESVGVGYFTIDKAATGTVTGEELLVG